MKWSKRNRNVIKRQWITHTHTEERDRQRAVKIDSSLCHAHNHFAKNEIRIMKSTLRFNYARLVKLMVFLGVWVFLHFRSLSVVTIVLSDEHVRIDTKNICANFSLRTFRISDQFFLYCYLSKVPKDGFWVNHFVRIDLFFDIENTNRLFFRMMRFHPHEKVWILSIDRKRRVNEWNYGQTFKKRWRSDKENWR